MALLKQNWIHFLVHKQEKNQQPFLQAQLPAHCLLSSYPGHAFKRYFETVCVFSFMLLAVVKLLPQGEEGHWRNSRWLPEAGLRLGGHRALLLLLTPRIGLCDPDGLSQPAGASRRTPLPHVWGRTASGWAQKQSLKETEVSNIWSDAPNVSVCKQVACIFCDDHCRVVDPVFGIKGTFPKVEE